MLYTCSIYTLVKILRQNIGCHHTNKSESAYAYKVGEFSNNFIDRNKFIRKRHSYSFCNWHESAPLVVWEKTGYLQRTTVVGGGKNKEAIYIYTELSGSLFCKGHRYDAWTDLCVRSSNESLLCAPPHILPITATLCSGDIGRNVSIRMHGDNWAQTAGPTCLSPLPLPPSLRWPTPKLLRLFYPPGERQAATALEISNFLPGQQHCMGRLTKPINCRGNPPRDSWPAATNGGAAMEPPS